METTAVKFLNNVGGESRKNWILPKEKKTFKKSSSLDDWLIEFYPKTKDEVRDTLKSLPLLYFDIFTNYKNK